MNNELTRILEIANEFLQVPSSIGYEKPFLEYLNKKIQELGYETKIKDKYLIVKNKDAKRLFSAHIDRHAIIQNKTNQIEYLAFYLKKQDKIPFKREYIYQQEEELNKKLEKEGYKTYLSDKFLHIQKDKLKLKFIREGGPDFFEKTALRYVGEETYSYDVETGIKINKFKIYSYEVNHKTPIVQYFLNPKPRINDKIFAMKSQIRVDNDIFSGQIDNVISIATLYYLLETTKFKDEIIFTTQEEIGKSYLNVIDYLKDKKTNPQLIVLDTTPYENKEELKQGPIILREGDENALFSKELTQKIKQILLEEKIPYKFKNKDIGITELGRILQNTKDKFKSTTLQIPTTNYHTTYETTTLKCLENYHKIIKKLTEQ